VIVSADVAAALASWVCAVVSIGTARILRFYCSFRSVRTAWPPSACLGVTSGLCAEVSKEEGDLP
jgi:hypothetical protein